MNRLSFWLIWLFGAGPMLLAVFLYFSGYSPSNSGQRGELLPPGVTLSDWELLDLAGEKRDANGQWQLLLISKAPCVDRCTYWQKTLPQVNQALGKDRDRVTWSLVAGSIKQKKPSSVQLPQHENVIWLADPNGNLVLQYSLEQTPKDLLKDLKRLLKVSRIG
jgi:cytochrome oxidase Cu insertion factor (SCO1/SenC/PrrC family)